MNRIRIAEMTWPDIGEAIKAGRRTVIVGLGSTEQHGPALPEHTDTVQADRITFMVARKLGNALMAPTLHLGCSDHHLSFPGTISLRPATLQAILADMVSSLAHHGFTSIVILPFHGGNFNPTAEILPSLRKDHPDIRILAFTDLMEMTALIGKISAERGFRPEEVRAHADAWESSNMLHLDPANVKPAHFDIGYTGAIGKDEADRVFSRGLASLTANGILGDSRRAEARHGEYFLEAVAEFYCRKIREA